MKKRIFAVIALLFTCAATVLSLAGCGDDSSDLRGVGFDYELDSCYYSPESDTTNVSIGITAYNRNHEYELLSFTYKIYFVDEYGNRIASRTMSRDDNIPPDDYQYITASFTGSDAIAGAVSDVRVVPVSMELSAEPYDEGSSSSSSAADNSTWGFWTWFWVIIAAILLILFFLCCLGAEGDTDAIVGGVIIFLAPALIILFVHFVFFF